MKTIEKTSETHETTPSSRLSRALGRLGIKYTERFGSRGRHTFGTPNNHPVAEVMRRIADEKNNNAHIASYMKRWNTAEPPLFTHGADVPPPLVSPEAAPTQASIDIAKVDTARAASITQEKEVASKEAEQTQPPFYFDSSKPSSAMQDPEFAALVHANTDLSPQEMVRNYQEKHGQYTTDIQGRRENFPLFTHGVEIVEPKAERRAPYPNMPGLERPEPPKKY